MKTLHVAAAQIHSGGTVDDILRRVEDQVECAAIVGADVILFAEGALQGYDYGMTAEWTRAVGEPTDGPACSQVCELARSHGLAILIGFIERDGETYYNSQLVARPDGTRGVQRKFVLTKIETGAGLSAGPRERTVFEFNGVKTAIVICADSSIDGLAEHLADLGVEYRFCPAGGGGKMHDMLHESDLRTDAGRRTYEENRPRVFVTDAIVSETKGFTCGYASANALGPVGAETCHQGHLMIVDNDFVMRAQMPGTIVLEHQQDQMIHAQLSFR